MPSTAAHGHWCAFTDLYHTTPCPAKISFFGESTFTLGAQVAITLAPDRPNELKCFNIAFGGVIAVFKSPREV